MGGLTQTLAENAETPRQPDYGEKHTSIEDAFDMSAEQLEELGLPSHEELCELADDGILSIPIPEKIDDINELIDQLSSFLEKRDQKLEQSKNPLGQISLKSREMVDFLYGLETRMSQENYERLFPVMDAAMNLVIISDVDYFRVNKEMDSRKLAQANGEFGEFVEEYGPEFADYAVHFASKMMRHCNENRQKQLLEISVLGVKTEYAARSILESAGFETVKSQSPTHDAHRSIDLSVMSDLGPIGVDVKKASRESVESVFHLRKNGRQVDAIDNGLPNNSLIETHEIGKNALQEVERTGRPLLVMRIPKKLATQSFVKIAKMSDNPPDREFVNQLIAEVRDCENELRNA